MYYDTSMRDQTSREGIQHDVAFDVGSCKRDLRQAHQLPPNAGEGKAAGTVAKKDSGGVVQPTTEICFRGAASSTQGRRITRFWDSDLIQERNDRRDWKC